MEEIYFKAGFAKVDITPQLGVCMAGYFYRREAEGILDPLYASALSVSDLDNNIKWILISCDLAGIDAKYIKIAKKLITERLGISEEKIMVHSTHIHTGPEVREIVDKGRIKIMGGQDDEYVLMLEKKIADVAQMASQNLKKATVEIGCGSENGISFIRRFRMKDGTIKSNPKIGDPDIIEPMGNIDPTVGVTRFKYNDGSGDVLVVNFALHPDMIGGNYFSADYPGHMRRAIGIQIPDCEVIYINGAAGDVNSSNRIQPECNILPIGYSKSRKVGNILAAEVIKVYNRLGVPKDVGTFKGRIRSGRVFVDIPLRKVNEQEISCAHEILKEFYSEEWKLKNTGKPPGLVEAFQTVKIANLGDTIKMEIQAITIDEIAYVGIPGEVFSRIGFRIKEGSPFPNTFISSITNGLLGYLPTKNAYTEGGYEAKNNPFTEELEGLIVNNSLELLNSLV
jgi:neutral ceramidase